jgi:hypothetical protein
MDNKLNPRVDLGFVFMSMVAFCTHVVFIFDEYTIGKGIEFTVQKVGTVTVLVLTVLGLGT